LKQAGEKQHSRSHAQRDERCSQAKPDFLQASFHVYKSTAGRIALQQPLASSLSSERRILLPPQRQSGRRGTFQGRGIAGDPGNHPSDKDPAAAGWGPRKGKIHLAVVASSTPTREML
jgi:hypothetical protein